MKINCSAWIGSIGLGLSLTAGAFADDSAAAILPPQTGAVSGAAPQVVPSAAASDLTPSEPAPPVIAPRQRDPGFVYPETYSKATDPLNISGLWHWLTGSDSDKKMDPTPVAGAPAEQGQVVQATHKPVMAPPPVPPPPPNPQMPAWRWYGYGAPVSGANPYAPDGVYGYVNPSYYYQTGATPGAIPQQLMPILAQPAKAPEQTTPPKAPDQTTPPKSADPTVPPKVPDQTPPPSLLPQPNPVKPKPAVEEPKTSAVPPEEPTVQPAIRQTANWVVPPVAPALEQPAATLEAPFPHTPTTPVAAPVIRGQAPDQAGGAGSLVPDRLIKALRLACTGYATKVEVTPRGDHRLALRLALARGAAADRVGALISKVPELAGYEVEMTFDR